MQRTKSGPSYHKREGLRSSLSSDSSAKALTKSPFNLGESSIMQPAPNEKEFSFLSPETNNMFGSGINPELNQRLGGGHLGSNLFVPSKSIPQVDPYELDPVISPDKFQKPARRKRGDSQQKGAKKVTIHALFNATKEFLKGKKKKRETIIEERIQRPVIVLTKSKFKARSLVDIDVRGPAIDSINQNKIPMFQTKLKSFNIIGRVNSLYADSIENQHTNVDSKEGGMSDRQRKLSDNYLASKQAEESIADINLDEDDPPSLEGISRKASQDTNLVGKSLFSVYSKTIASVGGLATSVLDNKELTGKSKFGAKCKNDEENQDEVETAAKTLNSTLKPRKERKKCNISYYASLCILAIFFFALAYIIVPLSIMLGTYHYDQSLLNTLLNFGLLGLLEGLVQIALLKSLVDRQIQKKMKQIEGNKAGFYQISKYLTMKRFGPMGILFLNIGGQIGVGFYTDINKIKVNYLVLLIESFCVTAVVNVLAFLLIWRLSPKPQKDGLKVLESEFGHITKARRELMSDLKSAKKYLDSDVTAPRTTLNFTPNITYDISFPTLYDQPSTNRALQGSIISVEKPSADIRNFQNGEISLNKNFKKVRLNSIKALSILLLGLAEILLMATITHFMYKAEGLQRKCIIVATIEVVGFLFGLMDFASWRKFLKLNTVKIMSPIITAAVYRFVFLDLNDTEDLIIALAVRYGFKLIEFMGGLLMDLPCLSCWKNNKEKEEHIEFYTMQEEMDAKRIKYPTYLLHKALIIQETDFFFAIAMLVAWLWHKTGASESGIILDFYTNKSDIYLWILIGEIGGNLILGMIFAGIVGTVLKRKAKALEVSVIKEIKNIVTDKKWIIWGFKTLVFFILCFIRSRGF